MFTLSEFEEKEVNKFLFIQSVCWTERNVCGSFWWLILWLSKLYLTHNHFGHLNVVVLLFKIIVCDFSMLSALDTISHY